MMIGYLIIAIRSVEKTEALKRESMLKQVINDFTSKDKISEMVIKEFPKLSAWWKNKQDQLESAEQVAVKSQSKVFLAEIASRVGHDIGGTMSNIEILTAEMNGLSEKHADALKTSINKVKAIASDIMDKTKLEMDEEKSGLRPNYQTADLNSVIQEIINQKNVLLENKDIIQFVSDSKNIFLKNINPLDLERSISNIVNNAIEASALDAKIQILVKSSDQSVEIQIKDSGFGIEPDNLKKIGMKGFTQGKINGNGIGLYYAKQFIEGLGGVFSVQSLLGQGTTVSMVIFN
jgi:signal transduction histidine kinase